MKQEFSKFEKRMPDKNPVHFKYLKMDYSIFLACIFSTMPVNIMASQGQFSFIA